jgi:anti-anti-sigma factor
VQLIVSTFAPATHRCSEVDVADSGRAVMAISGELDAYSVKIVEGHLREWLEDAGNASIDLSEVTLIDAAGSRLLDRLVRHAPGEVRFRDPSRIVRRVFDAIGQPMEPVLPTEADPVDPAT